MLKKYPHPNIVGFVTSFIKKDDLFAYVCIVMEYVDGYNLKQLVELQNGQKFEKKIILGFIT